MSSKHHTNPYTQHELDRQVAIKKERAQKEAQLEKEYANNRNKWEQSTKMLTRSIKRYGIPCINQWSNEQRNIDVEINLKCHFDSITGELKVFKDSSHGQEFGCDISINSCYSGNSWDYINSNPYKWVEINVCQNAQLFLSVSDETILNQLIFMIHYGYSPKTD